jgi:putative peptidoglycan lipid II flippase
MIYIAFLPRDVIVLAIGLSLSVIGTAQTLLAAWLLRRKLNKKLDATVGYSLLRGVIAGLIAGAVGLYVAYAIGGLTAGGFPQSGFVPALLSMVIIGIAVTVVFVLVLAVLKSPELGEARIALSGLRRRGTRE